MFVFCFPFYFWRDWPQRKEELEPISFVLLLADANVDFVGTGIAFYANWHVRFPFFFYFFTAARSFALRARGLKTNSSRSAVTGFLVSKCRAAS